MLEECGLPFGRSSKKSEEEKEQHFSKDIERHLHAHLLLGQQSPSHCHRLLLLLFSSGWRVRSCLVLLLRALSLKKISF